MQRDERQEDGKIKKKNTSEGKVSVLYIYNEFNGTSLDCI